MYLLNKAHVALVSGTAFGSPNCVRISYAASDEKLIEACDRIKNQLTKLTWEKNILNKFSTLLVRKK